jgi:hypothetical protein
MVSGRSVGRLGSWKVRQGPRSGAVARTQLATVPLPGTGPTAALAPLADGPSGQGGETGQTVRARDARPRGIGYPFLAAGQSPQQQGGAALRFLKRRPLPWVQPWLPGGQDKDTQPVRRAVTVRWSGTSQEESAPAG